MKVESSAGDFTRTYLWAGKIRAISFLLLFFFLFLLKRLGGYSYLNIFLVSLILVEAVCNQPYPFLLKRVNPYRFQFYQMSLDIIAISWLLYYMGGIRAPLVTIAYYAVILWAGMVSGTAAVFFSVLFSSLGFSSVVLLTRYGFLPAVPVLDSVYSDAHIYSLMMGNISFMFAFGYFSAYSSRIIRAFEREKIQTSLKHTHKLTAAGLLVSGIAHDAINNLAGMRGYVKMLEDISFLPGSKEEREHAAICGKLKILQGRTVDLVHNLSQFSQTPEEERVVFSLHKVIDEAVALTSPFARMSGVRITPYYDAFPVAPVDRQTLKEAFVELILCCLDFIGPKGEITVSLRHKEREHRVIITMDARRQEGRKKKKGALYFVKETMEKEEVMMPGPSIAKHIILRHEGEVSFVAQDERTVRVSVALPGETAMRQKE